MDHKICYLNTDLDLESKDDLTALAKAFEAKGIFPLHLTLWSDGLWHAYFEQNGSVTSRNKDPERNITAMIQAVESLSKPLMLAWSRCTLREFNIGYDCGDEPWAFNQGLSAELLGRISAAGASLRITIYPDRETAPTTERRSKYKRRKGN